MRIDAIGYEPILIYDHKSIQNFSNIFLKYFFQGKKYGRDRRNNIRD